ncbi:MAG: hypothetical protein PUK40_01395, partial [Actinomycetaceae bacterium]|nr:hypothetical protein [Actinomycetaceae bacterium]
AGAVRHGPIDLGAVEVGDDDLDALTEPEPEVESSANDAADEPYDVAGDALPELESGAMVLISDIALSEVPLLAKSERKTLGVLRLESSRVIVANESFDLHRKVFPRPSYSIVLTLDADTHSKPVMIVRRDDMRLTWDWSSAGEPFAWIADAGASTPDTDTPDDGDDSNAEVSAAEFVDSELGAGGVARLAVADLIDVRFADLRDALLADAAQGPRKVLELFGLPPEVADVLEGKRAVEDIPGAQIVEPKRAASTFEESLAWEIAGEGVVEPDMAKAYREVYLKRPWLTSVVAAGQAAIGGGVFMAGLRPRPGNTRSKLAIAVGAVLVVNALSRIGVSEYVQRALERNTNSGGVSE